MIIRPFKEDEMRCSVNTGFFFKQQLLNMVKKYVEIMHMLVANVS